MTQKQYGSLQLYNPKTEHLAFPSRRTMPARPARRRASQPSRINTICSCHHPCLQRTRSRLRRRMKNLHRKDSSLIWTRTCDKRWKHWTTMPLLTTSSKTIFSRILCRTEFGLESERPVMNGVIKRRKVMIYGWTHWSEQRKNETLWAATSRP